MRPRSAFRVFVVLFFALVSIPAAQAQTWQESDLHDFIFTDGAFPTANLIQAHDGNFYGTTYTGGANSNYGVAYKLTPSGTFTLLHSFASGTAGGSDPTSLVEGPDGNFYGTCGSGGTDSAGTFFKMTPAGVVTTLYNFNGASDGFSPSSVILGTDGNYWGTTLAGSANNANINEGTVFKITPAGALNTVYTFPLGGADGYNLGVSLVQASNGNFYGTALQTPGNEIILATRAERHPRNEPTPSDTDGGIIFSVTPAGSFSLAYQFGTADGNDPNVALVEGSNGDLYGETFYGAAFYGNIFSYAPGGAYKQLYSFNGTSDGGSPEGPLFLASDGNFYGTTSAAENNGATGGGGTVFKMTPSGTVTTLYTFGQNVSEGTNPESGVTQGSNGVLYGTAYASGSGAGECAQFGCGDIFTLTPTPALAAPVQLSLSSSTTEPGTAVTLSFKVLNAFSDTLQLCYAYASGANGATGYGTTWTGKQTGTLSPSTHLYTGSAQITPTADGTYTYALTCGGQESGSVTLSVSGAGKSTSTTALRSSSSSYAIGQSATLTATVTGSGSNHPTGSVAFTAAGIALGSVPVNGSGVAALTLSTAGQPAGTYPVEASYDGDTHFDSSNSAQINVTLTQDTTSTALTASPTTVTRPASVALTATVKRTSAGVSGSPGGSVTFASYGVTIATIKLNGSGVAQTTASTSGINAGTYPIIATYDGDSSDKTSASSAVTVTVK